MIKILNTAQIRELDLVTIDQDGISSLELMERACRAFTEWFTERFNGLNKVGIICGPGNNGGDGLGIARMLKDWAYPVKVWIVKGPGQESRDFAANLSRAKEAHVPLFEISTEADQNLFSDRNVLIDALFGSGLSRPLEGIYAQAIRCINQTDAVRISVDIPSGLPGDAPPSDDKIVRADHTIAFQIPKLIFFLPQYHQFVGEWHLVDIGLNKIAIKSSKSSVFMVTRKGIRKLLKTRSRFDHKGTFGHALLVAGSIGKMGAAVLSGLALIRSGAGLLTIHAPRCGYQILQTSLPEAMVSVDASEDFTTSVPDVSAYTVVGIGPGLGQRPETIKMVRLLLEGFTKPVVLDADALNIISSHRELLHLIPKNSILTPHPKEFERLVGPWQNDFDRVEKQKSLARELNSVIVVKGGYSTIVSPEGEVFFNNTGNPGMATGGTGDVLTGILTGLLAQGYSCLDSALVGVYLHGLAGDLGIMETGQESLIASDVTRFLPAAFRQLRH
jgi:NAD(P)H-hydrate epimerase